MLFKILSHISVLRSTFYLNIALNYILPRENNFPSVYAVIVEALFVLYNKANYPKASPGP